MKKVLSVLLALCLLLGSVPMFALAEEGDGQEPPRLHVYHGIDYDHWDDELGKDVFSYNPDAGHDPFWGTLPAFATRPKTARSSLSLSAA